MIPGEQISLRTTASALGVSVMPVRGPCTGSWPSRRWNSRPTARCACR
jgi:hypothetical protein